MDPVGHTPVKYFINIFYFAGLNRTGKYEQDYLKKQMESNKSHYKRFWCCMWLSRTLASNWRLPGLLSNPQGLITELDNALFGRAPSAA